ncbi:MAG: hypothetical protein LBV14_05265, partial [Acidovorax sp.]|nr:hypothetical protein [Acidovorax sp.]
GTWQAGQQTGKPAIVEENVLACLRAQACVRHARVEPVRDPVFTRPGLSRLGLYVLENNS